MGDEVTPQDLIDQLNTEIALAEESQEDPQEDPQEFHEAQQSRNRVNARNLPPKDFSSDIEEYDIELAAALSNGDSWENVDHKAEQSKPSAPRRRKRIRVEDEDAKSPPRSKRIRVDSEDEKEVKSQGRPCARKRKKEVMEEAQILELEARVRVVQEQLQMKSVSLNRHGVDETFWKLNLCLDKWNHLSQRITGQSCGEMMDQILDVLEIPKNRNKFTTEAAENAIEMAIQELNGVWAIWEYQMADLVASKNEYYQNLVASKQKIYDFLLRTKVTLIPALQFVYRVAASDQGQLDIDEEDCVALEDLKLSAAAELAWIILEEIRRWGYRKIGNMMYSERWREGYRTNSWKKLMTIEKWIENRYPRRREKSMWARIQKAGIAAIVAILVKEDEAFPTLIWDDSLSAWKNGWYVNMKTNATFQKRSLGDATPNRDYTHELLGFDRFIPYSRKDELLAISPDFLTRGCIKYIGVDFRYQELPLFTEHRNGREYKDFMKIPCPVDTYLTAQGYEEADMRLIYGMFGRMMHPLLKFDAYALLLVLHGVSGVGKSVLIKLLANFYDDFQIFMLSNSMEKTFGLQRGIDKSNSGLDLEGAMIRAWFAPDLREDWSMDEGNLLSMVAGEILKINEKFTDGGQAVWRIPGAIACNVFPRILRCKKGSWCDRLFVLNFWQSAHNPTAGLAQSCFKEFDSFYRKCALAYRWFCELSFDRQIWKMVTPKFSLARKRMLCHGNPFQSFLQDDTYVMQLEYIEDEKERQIQSENWIPVEELIYQFSKYREERCPGVRVSLTQEFIEEEMQAARRNVESNQVKEWPPGSGVYNKRTTWCQGINFRKPLQCNQIKLPQPKKQDAKHAQQQAQLHIPSDEEETNPVNFVSSHVAKNKQNVNGRPSLPRSRVQQPR